MILRPVTLLIFATAALAAAAPTAQVVIAVGTPGTDEYRSIFAEAAEAWRRAAAKGGAEVTTIGLDEPGDREDRAALRSAITSTPEGTAPLWIALIGHGTHDGREAKFNLRGPDLSNADLAEWLKGTGRPVAVINTTASSAPFIKALSGDNRIVITATKSGSEDSFARFGQYVAAAIDDPEADLDGDGGTSLLEAFLKAAEDVAEFYEKEGRIATEQALIDDNGDGLGTPASWFRGTRAIKRAKDGATPDGDRAHQLHLNPSEEERKLSPELRQRRDALESELFALRARKDKMDTDRYYAELERIASTLAEIYREAETAPDTAGDDPASST